jgi:hypothetical protein
MMTGGRKEQGCRRINVLLIHIHKLLIRIRIATLSHWMMRAMLIDLANI